MDFLLIKIILSFVFFTMLIAPYFCKNKSLYLLPPITLLNIKSACERVYAAVSVFFVFIQDMLFTQLRGNNRYCLYIVLIIYLLRLHLAFLLIKTAINYAY